MGLDGNPLFYKVSHHLGVRNAQGLLNVSKSGPEPRHTLEITYMSVWKTDMELVS